MQAVEQKEATLKSVKVLVAELPERQREVLWLRFGFATGRPAKLREIGQRLGVTRERTRQLEASALRQMRRQSSIWSPAAECVRSVIKAAGGIAQDELLLQQIGIGCCDERRQTRFLVRLVLKLDSEIVEERISGTRVWALRTAPLGMIPSVVELCRSMLRKSRIGLALDTVVERVRDEIRGPKIDRKFVIAVIRGCKSIRVEDSWLFDVSNRSGHRLFEIVSILKSAGIPLHFRMIRERLNNIEERESSVRAVQAFLERNPDLFVRTARGVYGLREWHEKAWKTAWGPHSAR